jgi:hypothetical protein
VDLNLGVWFFVTNRGCVVLDVNALRYFLLVCRDIFTQSCYDSFLDLGFSLSQLRGNVSSLFLSSGNLKWWPDLAPESVGDSRDSKRVEREIGFR